MFLMAYLPIFPAFLKLRCIDAETERPFRVPGGNKFLHILAYLPMVMIIISLFFLVVPTSFDAATLSEVLPITIGSIIFIAIGEIVVRIDRQ
jgi:amino acid transporter